MAARQVALIVGAGSGLSAALARRAAERGMAVALAARNTEKLAALLAETKGRAFRCDVTREGEVRELFAAVGRDLGTPDLVVFNPSARARGPLVELDPPAVLNTLTVSAYGGFLVAQQAVKAMLARTGGPSGSLFFTGASASVKGYAQSAPFAMGKFALRGLVQSLARELQPKNLHIAHFVIDGSIANPGRAGYEPSAEKPDALLDPDAIAQSYFAVFDQPRSAWTWEMELRPWVERF
ncbi:MAG TPA: SDR family NAD(P)-dependent oxidoreductase [Kiloniellales bacterium]|nr:SDR family NAD(P)-dependent oxidoreductase [Kiloniellales bacterium]